VHIAAEHGDSVEILRAMLDSDAEHTVSEMRNSRGYVIRLFLDGMTDTDSLDLDSRPLRSPSQNSVPCSVISMRNGVRRRPPLTLPFGPCITPVLI
jgi:hypothetical protein